jgi:AraC-like DNA-binding protein
MVAATPARLQMLSMSERLFLRLPDDPLCAPETTVPAHTLTDFAVPASLRRFVAHLAAYEERFAGGREATERVLPDGAARLLVEVQPGGVAVRLAGASAKPVLLTMRGHMPGLSVTLRPGSLPALFGVSAAELAERVVSWQEVVGPAHRDLPERLTDAADDSVRARLIFGSLRAMSGCPDPTALRLLEHAAARWREDAGSMSVRGLAASMELGERRLQQVFASQLGLSPRAWRRLQRLHSTLRVLRHAGVPQWAQVALRAGYYDQSHLINEFRALCGLTPEQFQRQVASGSSNTEVDPKAYGLRPHNPFDRPR